MPLDPGQVIDQKYRVVRCIGEGGMGAVYEGENSRIRRRVAIKTLHSEVARNEEVVARFEREAQAAGRIGSDHIMEVLDLGVLPSGERYLVMEFLDGEPLSKRIASAGRLSAVQLLPIIRQVLSGLGAAHAAGIIHRDLKPDNVYILRQKAGWVDFVKIIDFGISKFHSDNQGSVAMTRAGAIMGTPLYMSPEQANGSAEADARSDLDSVGMMMYEALSGALPFQAKSLNELLFEIVLSDLPRLEGLVPDLDPGLAALVAKATAKRREDRFQSAQEMLTALEPYRTASLRPGAYTLPNPGPSSSQPGTGTVPLMVAPAATMPRPAATPAWAAAGARQSGTNELRPLDANTNSAFAHGSQAGQTTSGKRSKAPLVIGLAVAVVFVFVAGGVGILALAGHKKAATASADTAPPVATSTATAPPTAQPTAAELVSALAPAVGSPPPSAAPSTAVDAATPATAPPVAIAPTAARPRPGTAAPGAAAPTAKPTAAPTAHKANGEPDWGY